MKEQLYKKVFIRSAEDLPKEEGDYQIHFKRTEDPLLNRIDSFDLSEDMTICWLQNVEWYWQPIEPISRERVIAYEFQCIETGHCYVDYIKREDLEEKGSKYKQIPLYYASELCPDAGERNYTDLDTIATNTVSKDPVNNDKAIIEKMEELKQKYVEILVHVGLPGEYKPTYNLIKALSEVECIQCREFANELKRLEQELQKLRKQ